MRWHAKKLSKGLWHIFYHSLWVVVNRWELMFVFTELHLEVSLTLLPSPALVFNTRLRLHAPTFSPLYFIVSFPCHSLFISFYLCFLVSPPFSTGQRSGLLFQQATLQLSYKHQPRMIQYHFCAQRNRSLWYFILYLIKLRARPTQERK